MILVHGIAEGGSAWNPVINQIADRDFIYNPTLPGHPGDTTNPNPNTITFQSYVDEVSSLLYAPSILVGHSFGGLVISQVAENFPQKVLAVVYVAGYLPRSGDSLFGLGQADTASQFLSHIVLGNGTFSVVNSSQLFFNGCTANFSQAAAIVESAKEPLGPLLTNVTLSSKFAGIPKYYISTLNDLVVTPAFQTQMYTNTPVQAVFKISSPHDAMTCATTSLINAINQIRANYTAVTSSPPVTSVSHIATTATTGTGSMVQILEWLTLMAVVFFCQL